MSKERTTLTRREFFRLCGRSVVLGGVALCAARLIERRQVVLSGQTCTHQGVCSGCGKRDACGLPPAVSRRRAVEGHS